MASEVEVARQRGELRVLDWLLVERAKLVQEIATTGGVSESVYRELKAKLDMVDRIIQVVWA